MSGRPETETVVLELPKAPERIAAEVCTVTVPDEFYGTIVIGGQAVDARLPDCTITLIAAFGAGKSKSLAAFLTPADAYHLGQLLVSTAMSQSGINAAFDAVGRA